MSRHAPPCAEWPMTKAEVKMMEIRGAQRGRPGVQCPRWPHHVPPVHRSTARAFTRRPRRRSTLVFIFTSHYVWQPFTAGINSALAVRRRDPVRPGAAPLTTFAFLFPRGAARVTRRRRQLLVHAGPRRRAGGRGWSGGEGECARRASPPSGGRLQVPKFPLSSKRAAR